MFALNIDGNVNITGSYKVNGTSLKTPDPPLSITTEEQATGEKFLGRDVYVKGWEGTITTATTTITNFFPTETSQFVSSGGNSKNSASSCYIPSIYAMADSRVTYSVGKNLCFTYGSNGLGEQVRIWVKYTHE
jgi:hypothetical protein